MKTVEELGRIAREALEFAESQPHVVAAEAFTAANGQEVGRFNYTSAIPCNGLEEPKGTSSAGIGLLVVWKTENGIAVGFGSEEGSLDHGSIQKAWEKALVARHHDPEFHSLPHGNGETKEGRTLYGYHDPDIMNLSPEAFCDAAWAVLDGVVEGARASQKLRNAMDGSKNLKDARIIASGDLTFLQERVAIASSAMREVQYDESTLAMAFVTAMVEKFQSKGSGYGTWTRVQDVNSKPGKQAIENAIASIGGARVPSGTYTVIFGPAAMAEILNLLLSSVSLDALYSQNSLFSGKLGERVAANHVNLYDSGNAPGLVASKGITCEGLPTGLTRLIENGVFSGTLTNWYETQRILHDPKAIEKLGQDPNLWRHALVPRNGFRFAERGGGRSPSSGAGTFGTNVFFTSSHAIPFDEMIDGIENGLILGRLWYVYPMGPQRVGDFTGTVVADSFVIRDGKIVGGLAINSLRINENLGRLLQNVVTTSQETDTPLVWAADSIRYMPKGTLVTGVPLEAIAGNVLATGM